jgi:hypothetical protein
MLGLPETHGQPLPETIACVVGATPDEYTDAAAVIVVEAEDEDVDVVRSGAAQQALFAS